MKISKNNFVIIRILPILIWLSEKPIDFTYDENIIYFSNENSVQKFEKSYYGQDLDKFKFITYLTQRNKSKNLNFFSV